MELPKNLKDEIWEYCRVNDISGVDDFILKMVQQGFTSEKFGATPWDKPAEIVEKEVIKEVEKIVEKEVPVEVIKEVEKIVEKEVFITDDEANLELKKKIGELEEELNQLKKDYSEDVEVLEKRISLGIKDYGELDDENKTLNRKISDLTNEISQLKEELEAEKAKPKQEDNDIYGENKRGFFGSNLSDLWNKKK